MRVNAKTLLEGRHVVLVPYEREHVPRYHMWMQSAELQKLTASEPLSLEQEFAMQRSWREDPDKCTFIVLERAAWDREPCSEETCMAGDVNLFLTDPGDHSLAEVEIMIAEPSCRGKGLGREATLIMMQYGLQNLGIKTYQAKIGMDNVVSISMFKKMHFKEVRDVIYGRPLAPKSSLCNPGWPQAPCLVREKAAQGAGVQRPEEVIPWLT
ncbi:alpha/beta-tubulin-N-acetyltransferase 9 isoform X4 [Petromyzon marinus]|uniref:N-acetyltransferase 9 isoform X4 n=1 Tax=Petromyzon marinus TaxID=7757 RepID=A0AAJ7X7H6_PETMA|nr:N-acetyltransferase 9 isoform X4 [Petromyzon marinus]